LPVVCELQEDAQAVVVELFMNVSHRDSTFVKQDKKCISNQIKCLIVKSASNPPRIGSRNVQVGQQVTPRFARGIFLVVAGRPVYDRRLLNKMNYGF